MEISCTFATNAGDGSRKSIVAQSELDRRYSQKSKVEHSVGLIIIDGINGPRDVEKESRLISPRLPL